MTLREIRESVVNKSGRNDLVGDITNYVDNGANEYIRAGQRFLDNRLSTGPTQGPITVDLSESGGATYNFPTTLTSAVRAVLLDSDSKFINVLSIVSLTDLFGLSADASTPLMVTFNQRDRTLTVYPAPDKDLKLQLLANLEFAPLTADTDRNWWSDQYPEVLVRSALYEIEIDYRNRAGAADWLSALEEDLLGIEKNIIEQESAGITVLPDLW